MEIKLKIIGPDEHPSRKQEIEMMVETMKVKIPEFYKQFGLTVNTISFHSTSSASQDATIFFDIETPSTIYPLINFHISTLGRGVYGPSKRELSLFIRVKNISNELETIIYNNLKLYPGKMVDLNKGSGDLEFSIRVDELLDGVLQYVNTYKDYAQAYDLFTF